MPVSAAVDDAADPIADLLHRLYAVISFEEGGEPDMEGLKSLFSPFGRITRVTPEGVDYLDPEGFLGMIRSMLEFGAYTSFHEFELAREVRTFGDVAQVWSFYETRRHQKALRPLGRGVNSIQLIRVDGRWFVLSLLWDEAHASPALDHKTVFAQRGDHA